jgi:hypothetical protein
MTAVMGRLCIRGVTADFSRCAAHDEAVSSFGRNDELSGFGAVSGLGRNRAGGLQAVVSSTSSGGCSTVRFSWPQAA